MAKPRLLDLFCGAGGAGMGYHRAGFEVVGVDIAPQPHYPFEFHQMDALAVMSDDWIANPAHNPTPLDFDAIHGSPPCQHFTRYRNNVKDITDRYADLLAPVRASLVESGLPYVIENVEGSPLVEPTTLCGSMFDLDVRRHRLFETNWNLRDHDWPCRHRIWGATVQVLHGPEDQ